MEGLLGLFAFHHCTFLGPCKSRGRQLESDTVGNHCQWRVTLTDHLGLCLHKEYIRSWGMDGWVEVFLPGRFLKHHCSYLSCLEQLMYCLYLKQWAWHCPTILPPARAFDTSTRSSNLKLWFIDIGISHALDRLKLSHTDISTDRHFSRLVARFAV